MANVTMIPARARRQVTVEEEKPKLRVCAYCRVSTDTEEQATSYEAQVEHYTEYIKKNPEWELADIYADDGISGTNTKKRDEFNRMIADCREGKIDMILTKSISRFARNTLDCIKYIRELKDKGIAVFFEKENINTLDAKGELLITIMASLAQQESQSLSQNVKMGIQFRYQAGKVQVNAKRFLGYDKDANGKLIINEAQAEVVKRIYREYLDGGSLLDICNSLMNDGILNGAGNAKWIPSTIHKILTNEKYIGDALLQKTVTTDFLEKKRVVNKGIAPQYYVEDSHEAIIPRDIYMRVQEEMIRRAHLRSGANGQKRRVYSSKYALTSLCTCEKCGDIFRRVAWNQHGQYYTVWRCCTRVQGGPEACDAPAIREDELHAKVMKAINEQVGKRSKAIKELKQMIKDTAFDDRESDLAKIESRLTAIQKELVNRATAKESYDDLSDEIARLREEKQHILTERAQERGKVEMKEQALEFLNSQTTEITEYDDQLVRNLIEQITIHPDLTLTVEFKSGRKVDV